VYQIESKSSLKTALLLGAATATAMSLSTVARADEQVETVIVTGSRIPQVGLYSTSPVTAVSQQEIKYEGTTNVETLLNNLPGVFADFTETASNGATGQATVDLRGLGATRTLVLVDGTRLMPSDPSFPVADLNQVPAALVDHVEVQTGGASAVYGSDALAGVVNFIMRRDFEGVEVDAQYSVNEADNGSSFYDNAQKAAGFPTAPTNWWGGGTTDTTLIVGTNTADGKGNVTAYVGYRNTQAVLESARDFSACSISTNSHDQHVCAGSSNYNRFISIDDNYAAYGAYYGVTTPIPTSFDFFEHGTGAKGSGNFVQYTGAPSQKFNYGALNYLQRPDTRYTGGFFAHYQINPHFDLYSDFMFSDDHTLAQIAPSGAFLGTGKFGGLNEINCANPLMTAQEAAALCGFDAIDVALGSTVQTCTPVGTTGNCNLTPGEATLEIGRRDVEGGNRIDDLRHTAYRMKVGMRGEITDGWSYDVYGQYGTTIYAENYRNEWSVQRTQNALQVNPDGNCVVKDLGLDAQCVPLDIFNGIGSVTPNMLKYVSAQGFKSGNTEERVVSASITGDFGRWGGQSPWAKNPISLAVGAEYRSESLELLTSRDFQLNDLYGQGSATLPVPTSGFNVEEGFAEVRVPIVQDAPFAKDLTINGGYRYSSYNTAGVVSSYKYGIEWQVVDDIRFRGSYQHAVRAPNVLELFTPNNTVLFGGQDPCANPSDPVIIANCKAHGVPNTGSSVLTCPASQCNQLVGGNTGLSPEGSNTWSVGAVLTPTFLEGFSATVDYFDIKVNKFIGSVDPNVTLAECYGHDATAGSQAFFCPLVEPFRNGLHQIWAGGFVSALTQNTGFLSTRGIDFEANYNSDLSDWGINGAGSLSVNFIGTLLTDFTTEPLPGLGQYDCKGLYGVVCGTPDPEWRHKMRVTWTSPWDFAVSLDWRHISGVSLDINQSNPLLGAACGTSGLPCPDLVDGHLPSMDYFDLAANWTVHSGIELRFGVDNLFDKSPPVVDSNNYAISAPPFGNGNTFPGVYDSLGRTFFVGITAKY
jgi:iron complex outermembrane recepter protein